MSTEQKQLKLLFDQIFQHIGDYRFDLIDQMLIDISLEQPTVVLLGLARGTYAVRSRLNNWTAYVKDIQTEFDKRNLDSSTILKGLI